MNLRGKNRFFNLRFLYSQDLSNYKTEWLRRYRGTRFCILKI